MRNVILLQLAGALQISLLIAGATMARAVEMPKHLATLPPLLRRLYWVYFAFIALSLLGFGLVTLSSAEALAAGGTLARAFCTFILLFWLARLVVQFFVLDVRPYLHHWFYRAGYHLLTVVFIYLTAVYGWFAFLESA